MTSTQVQREACFILVCHAADITSAVGPTGYDPVTSTTVFFQNVSDSQLQYTPVALSQPQIRDEVPSFRALAASRRCASGRLRLVGFGPRV